MTWYIGQHWTELAHITDVQTQKAYEEVKASQWRKIKKTFV